MYFDKNLCYQRTSSADQFGAKFGQFILETMDILGAFVVENFKFNVRIFDLLQI